MEESLRCSISCLGLSPFRLETIEDLIDQLRYSNDVIGILLDIEYNLYQAHIPALIIEEIMIKASNTDY